MTSIVARLLSLFACFTAVSCLFQAPLNILGSNSKHFEVTAVTHHSSPPHHSRIQCLRITSSTFHTYPTIGSAIFLSEATNLTYVVLPPGSGEGWHRPPAPMWFVLLSGQARVETPHDGRELWIEPGRNQIILALDTLGKGHLTFYPGEEETVALQIPLADDDGGLEWKVLREGAC